MSRPKLSALIRAYASQVRDEADSLLCDGAEAAALRDVADDLEHIVRHRRLPTAEGQWERSESR